MDTTATHGTYDTTEAVLYLAFLLAPWAAVQIGLVMLVKLLTLGWYSVLQGEAYAAAPGRSGTVMALTSLGSLLGGIFPWLIGVAAQELGLRQAMWLLLLGPLSLILFVPRKSAPGLNQPGTNLLTGQQ